jgi:hypothetical protein
VRQLTELPSWKKSSTDTCEPRRVKPKIESVDPILTKLRREIELPKGAMSSMLSVLPSCIIPYTLRELPMRRKDRTDNVLPRKPQSRTEMELLRY